jgi:uncharacterized protein (DUF1800 family)
MARTPDRQIEHLLRRAGFGARPDELDLYGQMSVDEIVDSLVEFQSQTDDVDSKIGKPGYVGTTTRGVFSPNSNITDARQRWLFRMVHSDRPLQEKMALFWHDHFATGYTKIAGALGATEGTRYMAAKPSEDAGGVRGQLHLFRDMALGNFRDLLTAIAKDAAMLVWLDGRTNFKAKPQENFAREIMELFTMGVGNYTEQDVYAGARVFTGWNLQRPGSAADGSQHYEFFYSAAQHDTDAKTFSFAIYPDGGKTIPARAAAAGMQDGLDFIAAVAANPNTGRYLAKKLFRFFVSEFREPDESFVNRIAGVFLNSRGDMRRVMREVFLSSEFWDSRSYWARFAWPVEYVVRSLKDIGWTGFSVDTALTPLANMGQTLFDPPDVSGWPGGPNWISSATMLARMNFASTLAGNQRFNLGTASKSSGANPRSFLSYFMDQIATSQLDTGVSAEWMNYLTMTGTWTGTDAQLQAKAAGLVHLIAGSPEYQLQ